MNEKEPRNEPANAIYGQVVNSKSSRGPGQLFKCCLIFSLIILHSKGIQKFITHCSVLVPALFNVYAISALGRIKGNIAKSANVETLLESLLQWGS